MFNVKFTPAYSLHYILHHCNPTQKRTISMIPSLIVWIILWYTNASVQVISIHGQTKVTTDTAANRSTIRSIHASGRCLAGNTRVPVKDDAIGWGNWLVSRDIVHVPPKQCTVEGNVPQFHLPDFRMVSACVFQLGYLRARTVISM